MSSTVNDVAKLAGVSRQTVSNVLNAPERVRPETQHRVRDAIAQLDYQPHHFARNLRIRSSSLIGYCVPLVSPASINPVMDRFLHALSAAARDHGYHVLLFTPTDADDELATYAELIARRAVDGFVMSYVERDDPRIAYLQDRDVPFCAFGRTSIADDDADPSDRMDWVDVDGAHGMRAVVTHLIDRGHRRVAFLGWPEGITVDERFRGYTEALIAAGIDPNPQLDVRGPDVPQTGADAIAALLTLDTPPTALVAASDLLASGAVEGVRGAGLRIGDQFAIAGFDDTPVARFLSPALTSLRQPLETVAAEVVRLLTERLDTPTRAAEHLLLEPELIVRNST